MPLFIILGVVVLVAVFLLGFLFYLLDKEAKEEQEDKAVPLKDLSQLKQEFSSPLLGPQIPKTDYTSDIVPTVIPQVSLPTQASVSLPVDDMYKKRAQELEEELRGISEKAEHQSDEAKQMIAALTQENESLKSKQADLIQAQQKLVELQSEADHLHTENSSLQTRLDSTNAKMRLLEEEIAVVKVQMGEEIRRANATVSALTQEKEVLLSAPKPEPDQALHQELESLKSEQAQLKQNFGDLEKTYQQLRELNTQLMEKNDLLQYELVKARAQAAGLERIEFNYKNQLEDSLKRIKELQSANDQSSGIKNRLEAVLQEVKSQNEELVKKGNWAQFELEKNRSELINLMREYEDFKARAQQKT